MYSFQPVRSFLIGIYWKWAFRLHPCYTGVHRRSLNPSPLFLYTPSPIPQCWNFTRTRLSKHLQLLVGFLECVFFVQIMSSSSMQQLLGQK